jgi:hypothetical protein
MEELRETVMSAHFFQREDIGRICIWLSAASYAAKYLPYDGGNHKLRSGQRL